MELTPSISQDKVETFTMANQESSSLDTKCNTQLDESHAQLKNDSCCKWVSREGISLSENRLIFKKIEYSTFTFDLNTRIVKADSDLTKDSIVDTLARILKKHTVEPQHHLV